MKLLVAIDGKDSAKTALEYIIKRNYDSSTQIHLLHVMVPGFADAPVEGIPDVVAIEKSEEQGVLNQLAKALETELNFTATTHLMSGETAEVVAEACKQFKADELIVPSHHRHGFSRLWFGSVADEIVDAADCTAIVLNIPENTKAQK